MTLSWPADRWCLAGVMRTTLDFSCGWGKAARHPSVAACICGGQGYQRPCLFNPLGLLLPVQGLQCWQHPRQTFVALRVASIFFIFYFLLLLCLLSESEGSIKGWLLFFLCNVWGSAGWWRVYLNVVGCKHACCRYREQTWFVCS